MSLQVSIPVISNATLFDRMFRTKPYTKCIDCLADNRLKCKKCMEGILDDITRKNQPKTKSRIAFSTSFNSTFTRGFKSRKIKPRKSLSKIEEKQNTQKLILMNKFDMWLEVTRKRNEVQRRRVGVWPRKVRLNDKNLEKHGIKQPKFEKWEKKLLDKLISKTVKQ